MRTAALCAGAVMLAGAMQAEEPEERNPAFRALLSAIRTGDAAAIEAMSRRDIMLMRLYAIMPAWELVATLEGCTIDSVRAASDTRFIRFSCPERRRHVPQGSCDSGDFTLSAQAIEGRIRLSLTELRADRRECIPPPPPPSRPPRNPQR